jgi:hypothetical protein
MPFLFTGRFFGNTTAPAAPVPEFNFVERSPKDVHAWQGVAFDGTHYYVAVDFTNDFQQWTLQKYGLDWNRVLTRSMGADGDAAHSQINGVYYDSGADKLYVCANNYNTSPNRGWVFEVSPSDLTVSAYHDLGAKWTEAVWPWGGYWWEVNASGHEIRQFDSSWTLVNTHALPDSDPAALYWQAIFVIDDVFYVNHHATGGAEFRAYTWNGSGFTAASVGTLAPPSGSCTQGVFFDGNTLYWAERIGTFPPNEGYVVITSAYDTLRIIGKPTTMGRDDIPFESFTVSAIGGTAPYTYTVHSGSLPAGLTLNSSSGVVSGTPTTPGTSSGIVIRVTDDDGATADLASFSIDIASAFASSAVWEEIGRQTSVSGGKLTLSGLNLVGYSMVQIILSGITTGTNDTFVKMRFMSGGSEISGAGFYKWGDCGIPTSGSRHTASSTEDDAIVLVSKTTNNGLDEASTAALSGRILLDNPGSSVLHKRVGYRIVCAKPDGNQLKSFGAGWLQKDATQIDGIVIFGSSNLTGGKVIVLGIQ